MIGFSFLFFFHVILLLLFSREATPAQQEKEGQKEKPEEKINRRGIPTNNKGKKKKTEENERSVHQKHTCPEEKSPAPTHSRNVSLGREAYVLRIGLGIDAKKLILHPAPQQRSVIHDKLHEVHKLVLGRSPCLQQRMRHRREVKDKRDVVRHTHPQRSCGVITLLATLLGDLNKVVWSNALNEAKEFLFAKPDIYKRAVVPAEDRLLFCSDSLAGNSPCLIILRDDAKSNAHPLPR
ncbi:hypothetical protein TCDM_07588 [Trypanosoma cruzi Dm28c]|uniref:Uncharacterized protein n=1 Tax=Trypanosoma cruzi Dm28c TaxID=1416333 RepID=V5AU71_TRYCR|nr:hypothetical protein TCDM_07588 [Trypanosoma cruzi Dm28c]